MSLNGFTPGQPSHAKTTFDALPLPGGKTVGDEPNLASVLVDLNIPGASHSNGRPDNAEAYAKHVHRIRSEAGNKALAAWLESQ